MGAFTSKSAASAPPRGSVSDVDRAILDLKNARDRLHRYRKKLDEDDAKLVEKAKQAKADGKIDRALGIMRLRKYKQQQASDCETQLLNVLTMVETIDSKQNDKQMLQALEAGKNSLKLMHEETSVEKVLNLMEEIKEEIEVEQEITDILQGVPTLSATDEEAVEKELAAMMMEAEQQKPVVDAPAIDNMPVAPDTKLPGVGAEPVKPQQQQQPERRVAVPG